MVLRARPKTRAASRCFLSILRNESAPFEEVKAAAKEALPYTSPKLASIEARGGGQTHEDRLEELQRLAAGDE